MNFNKLNKIISEDNNWQNNPTVQPNTTNSGAANAQIKGNINIQRVLKYFPDSDPVKLKMAISYAMRGNKLNNLQLMTLGNAFVDLLKAPPQETVQLMNLLKKVSMENE